MSYWNDPNFQALQKAWYQRLKSEGFRDAEELRGGEFELKEWASHPYMNERKKVKWREVGDKEKAAEQVKNGIREKELYFNLVSHCALNEQFPNQVDQLILNMYAEGARICEICEAISRLGTTRCRNTVTFTIRKYEMKWGMRAYTQKQLNIREPK